METGPVKTWNLPDKHVRIRKIRAQTTALLAARGTWKTTRALPLFVDDMVKAMPRSSGMACGISFEDMNNNTINPLLGGLAEMGYFEGEHYVYCKRPPSWFDTPYLGVLNGVYSRVLSFQNGTACHVVSMEKKAPANGLSVQWGFFDEVKFQDQRKLEDKIFPTFRGNEEQFKHLSCYLSKFLVTDKEADPAKIKWLLDMRKQTNPEQEEIIIAYQDRLLLKYEEFRSDGIGKARQKELYKEIQQLEQELNDMRTGLVHVAEININDVAPFLSKAWYDDKRRNATPRIWKVVYLNEDPETAGDTFYPCFDKDVHSYTTMQEDIDRTKGFILTPDYQHSVAPLTVSQLTKLPWREDITLNYVDVVYTLPEPSEKDVQDNGNGSKGSLAEAVQLFCDRYKSHPKKVVYYVYDHTAKGKRINADEYWKIVAKVLKKNKWRVVKVYVGKMSDHYARYVDTSAWLKHEDKTLPAVLINAVRCVKLITSIINAAAKSTNGKTEKNKEYENTARYPGMDQSETTHFSDCFDICNHAVLSLRKIKTIPTRTGTGMRG